MNELETGLSLVKYKFIIMSRKWNVRFNGVVDACGVRVTTDPVSIASILSFGWAF